jgi:glycosyltransferase involved in cell wall biosynthesis
LTIALVHDYLTQRGGAERVVLSLCKAFPDAPLYTSLYEPRGTFPEFGATTVLPSALNRLAILRRYHRLGLPLYPPVFSRMVVDADVVLCSSSGWAHGVRATGRKIVYCHTPARWLYQSSAYVGARRARVLRSFNRPLEAWDQSAARTADCYVANSRVVQGRIKEHYGIDAEVIPPPHTLDPSGAQQEVASVRQPYFVCVSRLLRYKNVDAIIDAFRVLPELQLVIVGTGPAERQLRAAAPPNVRFIGPVPDADLRWLYAKAVALIAASYEDYGLTPLEAAAMGTPAVVLRWGGFLDTVRESETGEFFDEPRTDMIVAAVRRVLKDPPSAAALRLHADRFSEHAFIQRIREVSRSVTSEGR